MSFSLDLAGVNCDRFDHYARFVKRLEIYPTQRQAYGHKYAVNNWSYLLERAKSKVLLPNLVQLTLNALEAETQEQCLWIRMFMSPSLNVIQVLGHPWKGPFIDPLAASVILGQIVSTCPNLHTLSILPAHSAPIGAQHNNSHNDPYAALKLWESPESFYRNLNGLGLRELACTINILSPRSIAILGQLPLLEILEVRCSSPRPPEPILVSPPIAPELKWLPLLHRFSLHSVDPTTAIAALKLGIFSGLKSLRVSLTYEDYTSEDDEGVWVMSLMTLIPRACPALNDLEFRTHLDIDLELRSISFMEPLALLPLRSVCIEALALHPPLLEELINAWPLVTRLDLSELGVPMSLLDLPCFVALPNLEHLILNLSANSEDDLFWEEDELIPVSTRLHTLQCRKIDISVGLLSLSNFLLALWPNLCNFGMIEQGGKRDAAASKDRVIADALNTMIAMQRDRSASS